MIKKIYNNFIKYQFLLKKMINRDFKVKYKKSILGIIWSLLYPILMMSVMALVFSQMFKFRVSGENYLVYLLTGLIVFNYFSEATNTAMSSIIVNFNLINKVYIPKYIFPLSKCLFSGINFLLSLVPLLLIAIITKAPITINYLLLPYVFICIFMFSLGIGLLLSTISIFLRDMFYIYGIILTIWNYFTPIFYEIQMLPENLQHLFKYNPLYQFVTFMRTIVLEGSTPNFRSFLWCFLSSIIILIIGCVVFKKKQDKFIYYS